MKGTSLFNRLYDVVSTAEIILNGIMQGRIVHISRVSPANASKNYK
jgi:hypothetical protein